MKTKKTYTKKHKNLLRRKKDDNSTYWRKKADTQWSLLIRRIWPDCVVCGKNSILHAHHLVTRSIGGLRHDLNNGISLCPSCHMYSNHLSAHKAPFEFMLWLEEHRPTQYMWAKEHRRHVGKYNYKEKSLQLELMMRNFEDEAVTTGEIREMIEPSLKEPV